MRGLSAILLSANNTLCILNRDPALRSVHEHDECDHYHKEYQDCQRFEEIPLRFVQGQIPQSSHINGEACQDAGEQEHRDAVADSLVVDPVSHPDNDGSTGDKGHDDNEADENIGCGRTAVRHCIHLILQRQIICEGHERSQCHCNSGCNSVEFLLPLFSLIPHAFQRREGVGQQLHNNGGVDIRCDGQRENGCIGQRTTGQDIQVFQEVTIACVAGHPSFYDVGIQKRNHDCAAHAEDQKHE